MRVAVVTPFHNEPDSWLLQAHESVLNQTHACDHIMVGDASSRLPPRTAIHVPLPRNVADYGDTPRSVGVMYAAGLGYDAVCFLDGDNWFAHNHVATVVQKHLETGAAVVTAERMLIRLDGTPMARCVASDGVQFCDTNCLSVFREAFPAMAMWATMPRELHPIDDRVVWKHILDSGLSRAHTAQVTVNYRATAIGFYRDLSEPAPKEAKESVYAIREALRHWKKMGHEQPVRWAYRAYTPPSAQAAPAPKPDPQSVLYFHPEAYTTTGPKLMGRNAAGESFLKGYIKHSTQQQFTLLVNHPTHANEFKTAMAAEGKTQKLQVLGNSSLHALKGKGTMYLPGPSVGGHAWHRAMFGHHEWSLCGITHTTSSARAMDAICDLLVAPVQPWDALICTSTAVKNNVEQLLNAQADYLRGRFAAAAFRQPMLPVIPLGIHTRHFEYTPAQRDAARRSLNVDANTLVVLFMGRLSFHAKAHPLAMYQALELAAQRTGKRVVLVECGWHANEFIQNAYREAAQLACPSVRVHTLNGRDAAERQTAWAGADVFCSLSDNIQETFGIAPIEAMAAGLPVVVSDWDGYRDTVVEGLTGFRTPTLMPRGGLGGDMAHRHALEINNYDMYCGYTSSLIAVDVQATALAFEKLFGSPELRRQMGDAGRERARTVYDWAAIIPKYEQLWAEQNELRKTLGRPATGKHPWPARMDPFHSFSAYPSQVLSGRTLLCRVHADLAAAQARLAALHGLEMVKYTQLVLPTLSEMNELLAATPAQPTQAGRLVANVPEARLGIVFRGLAHLVKLGLLNVVSPPTPDNITA